MNNKGTVISGFPAENNIWGGWVGGCDKTRRWNNVFMTQIYEHFKVIYYSVSVIDWGDANS